MKRSAISAAVFAAISATAAAAAELPVKAPPPANPFLTTAGSGWYVGVGTEGALAASSVSGTNFPSLTGGNLTADGGAVGVDAGYIWGSCLAGTRCQVEVDADYQNISGANSAGAVKSLWSVSEEFDFDATLFQNVATAINFSGLGFPTFSPNGLLPRNLALSTTPWPYLGFMADEFDTGGSFGSSTGQSWTLAYGLTAGWRWQTLNSSGQPNGGSFKVHGDILFASRGVTLNDVFAAGKPVTVGSSADLGDIYRVGVTYDFGL